MQIGDLVKCKWLLQMGVVTKVNQRDLSFYKSHTYFVEFSNGMRGWAQDFELEVICK